MHKAGQKEREERKERAAALRCATCGALCSITFTGCAQPAGRAAVPGHEGPSQPIARGRCAGRGHCGRWGTKGAESSGRVWGAAFSAVTLGLSGRGGERPWGVRAPDRRAAVGGTCGWSSEILTSRPAQAVLRFCAETSEIAGSNPPRQAVRTLRCRRRAASRGPPESNAGRALQTRLLSEGRLVVSLLLEGCFGAVPAARGAFGGVPAAGIAWAPAQQEQPVVQRAPRRARLLPAAGWGQQLTRSATKRHPSRCCAFFPPRPGFALRRPPRSASRRCGAPLLCPPAAPPPRWETGAVLALPRTLPTVLEVLGRRCALGAAPGSRLRGCSAA